MKLLRLNRSSSACLVAALGILFAVSAAAQALTPIAANDNRTPAGELRDGVLHLEFNIEKANWFPESDTGESIPSYVFAEVGKPPQAPGPTIRVSQGTAIDITLHNTLTVAVTLHGLHQRPGDDSDVIAVNPDQTTHVRFDTGAPGTYLYWGRTPDGGRGRGGRIRVLDALLGGALVVDPPGTDPTQDRIFVLERWNGARRAAINGKSWPFTERLDAEVGKEVHWKIVNASDLSHPMHLHGFHFWLDAEGDSETHTVFDKDDRREEFTHSVPVMETFDITWLPKEPGRWLYHCHRMPHMRMPLSLDPSRANIPDHVEEHDHMGDWDSGYAGMGGMVMGLTVTGHSEFDTETNWNAKRRVSINVGNRNGDPTLYELSLKDLTSDERPAMSTGLTGPLLVVTEGQNTEITVTNSSQSGTGLHWHGQEIESYYDGVPWWSGIGEKRAPLVEPGHEFRVKLIPQRAGSFLYHAHWHDGDQLRGGVQGPMIVMPPGETYDPATDKAFIMTNAPRGIFGSQVLLMNGRPQPAPMRLKVGTTYRLRFMNITPFGDELTMGLLRSLEPVHWRPLAKDAVDVEDTALRQAQQHVAVGETFDFEFRATKAEELRLEGWLPGTNQRVVQVISFE